MSTTSHDSESPEAGPIDPPTDPSVVIPKSTKPGLKPPKPPDVTIRKGGEVIETAMAELRIISKLQFLHGPIPI